MQCDLNVIKRDIFHRQIWKWSYSKVETIPIEPKPHKIIRKHTIRYLNLNRKQRKKKRNQTDNLIILYTWRSFSARVKYPLWQAKWRGVSPVSLFGFPSAPLEMRKSITSSFSKEVALWRNYNRTWVVNKYTYIFKPQRWMQEYLL